jgi:signal transduction histidine kinase
VAKRQPAPDQLDNIAERKALEDERQGLLVREQAARAEAEAQRAWLYAVLDQLPAGVLLYDAKGRIRFYNQEALARSVGETGQVDPFGNPIIHDVRLPSGEPFPILELPTYRTIESGEIVQAFEMLLRQRDGRVLTVRGRSVPVFGPHGERLGTVAAFQDITALKALEREREEWISIVTHDLRQPVTVILGYATILRQTLERKGTASQQRAVRAVLAAAQNLNRMIGDLLDVSRIDARRLTLRCETVDLPALIRTVVERQTAIGPGRTVRLTSDGDVPPIVADPGRIEQILDNLLSNAVKYGDPGTDILVQVVRRDAAVVVSVSNHGKGIPPEEIPKLFTRFYRTAEAREGRAGGLGLGLYISKGLVEAHGGQIWAESVPGQETTLTFTLPD